MIDRIDWLLMLMYAAVLTGISLYHWRSLRKEDDLFLAGRSMSRWPVAISMYMALFSTNSFIGLVGWLNDPHGTLWIAMQNIGIIAAAPLVILLFPALFYRLGISTAYEYLEKRFNYPVRACASIFFMAARIMWMSTMLYAASLVISKMIGWTAERGHPHGLLWSIVATGLFGMFFALAGGMHAVIWTDVAQFFIVIAGVSTMAFLSIRDSGGIGQVIRIAHEAGKFRMPHFFSLNDDLSVVSGFLLGSVAYLSNGGADQLILQTYLSGKSEREVKGSLWRNGLILKPISIIYPILGLLTYVYYHEHPEIGALLRIPDDALPIFVIRILPGGLRGLMIAAILSALLTSLSGGLASLSATLQIDFIRRWMILPMSGRGAVLLGRGLIFLWGIGILLGALWVSVLGEKNNIIQVLNIVMYPFVGVLLGIFLLGLLSHRANSGGTLCGATAGSLVTVAFAFAKVIVKAVHEGALSLSPEFVARLDYVGSISSFYYGFLGVMVTVLVGALASYLFAPPRDNQIRGLTRRSMPPPRDIPEPVSVSTEHRIC